MSLVRNIALSLLSFALAGGLLAGIAFAETSRPTGSSVNGTWSSLECGVQNNNQALLVGLRIRVLSGGKTDEVSAICKRGDATSQGRIWWSAAGAPPYTLYRGPVPAGPPSAGGRQEELVCPRHAFVTGIAAGFLGVSGQLTNISLQCTNFSAASDGSWAPQQSTTVQTGSAGTIFQCGASLPAHTLKVKISSDLPTGLQLECSSAAPRREPTEAELIGRRVASVLSPVLWGPNAAAQAAGRATARPGSEYQDPNFGVQWVLKGPLPGADYYKAVLSTKDGRVRQTINNITVRYVGGVGYITDPERYKSEFNGQTVTYEFYGCTADGRCSRPFRSGFHACAMPAGNNSGGCTSSAPGGMVNQGGGGSTGANSLSFARDIYPVITSSSCFGCHAGNDKYPQKLPSNAAECGVTREPAIPFSSTMPANQMLERWMCLKGSSGQPTYGSALGKKYVVPGNPEASGLHHKAQSSPFNPPFTDEVKNAIKNWIAQGARP